MDAHIKRTGAVSALDVLSQNGYGQTYTHGTFSASTPNGAQGLEDEPWQVGSVSAHENNRMDY